MTEQQLARMAKRRLAILRHAEEYRIEAGRAFPLMRCTFLEARRRRAVQGRR